MGMDEAEQDGPQVLRVYPTVEGRLVAENAFVAVGDGERDLSASVHPHRAVRDLTRAVLQLASRVDDLAAENAQLRWQLWEGGVLNGGGGGVTDELKDALREHGATWLVES